MLGKIDPARYDIAGKSVAHIRKRHRLVGPEMPFGRFFSRPLQHSCQSLDEVRTFLHSCRYTSDARQFGKDYWQPPEEFESKRAGDCEDFSLWTWRQLVALGYECRFVDGNAGFFRSGHAWLTVKVDDAYYVLEPQARRAKLLPRLTVAGYQPVFSAEWTGEKVIFFEHAPNTPYKRISEVLPLLPEWLWFHVRRWSRFATSLLLFPARLLRKAVTRTGA